jgi:hypothetical protein
MWEHIISFHFFHQKNHILIANDNTYIISQKIKVYFVDFFSFKIPCHLQVMLHATCLMQLLKFQSQMSLTIKN